MSGVQVCDYCGRIGASDCGCPESVSAQKGGAMSRYNGWSDVPLTPEETWAERAEAFRRGMTEVDQAGDMLAVERARAARWKAVAKQNRQTMPGAHCVVRAQSHMLKLLERERDEARATLNSAMDEFLRVSRERDEARAALMKRITRDAA